MILKKYILKHFFNSFIRIFMVLFFLLSCRSFLQILFSDLAQFFSKTITLKLLLYSSTTIISIILPISFLLAIIFIFNKFYSKNEIIIMKNIGFNDLSVFHLLLKLSLLFSIVLFFVYFCLDPICKQKSKELLTKVYLKQNADNLPVKQFFKIKDKVFFINSIQDSKLKGVTAFYDAPFANEYYINVIGAKDGFMQKQDSTVNFNLKRGFAYVMDKNKESLSVNFEQYNMSFFLDQKPQFSVKEFFLFDLIHADDNAAKSLLAWKLATVFSLFVLAVLAFGLSKNESSPVGDVNLIFAILVYIFYFLSLLLSKRVMENDFNSGLFWFIGANLFFLFTGCILIIKRRFWC